MLEAAVFDVRRYLTVNPSGQLVLEEALGLVGWVVVIFGVPFELGLVARPTGEDLHCVVMVMTTQRRQQIVEIAIVDPDVIGRHSTLRPGEQGDVGGYALERVAASDSVDVNDG